MKIRLIIFFLFLTSISGTIWYSCSKESESQPIQKDNVTQDNKSVDELMMYYYAQSSKDRNVFNKIWKWISAHVGTHLFQNCNGSSQCGPCPGICIPLTKSSDLFTPVDENYQISNQDYLDGERLCQIALFNDSIMGFTFIHDGFVYQDSLYIPKDFDIGSSASALFEKTSIIVKKGTYPVSFSQSRNGSTIVNVECK